MSKNVSVVEVIRIKPALQALGASLGEVTSPVGFAKIRSARWALEMRRLGNFARGFRNRLR
jgi:hypothetical protein